MKIFLKSWFDKGVKVERQDFFNEFYIMKYNSEISAI